LAVAANALTAHQENNINKTKKIPALL